MYLKKIELFGFKSFADKTEITFERGVTCVVGPNGCGKSNISDSIRWVLGERSAKLLRGAKMEDVIFGGTEFRKPLNLCEVSLVIDNTDQKLPLQYSDVVITLRLHRSGESEYLINKTPCRLKDIQDLIADTGLGSNSYSMIEQGRIDYILNAEADERRYLIEEAAGISKYKIKKEEAIRKLERTDQNLLRLNDIVAEVERNIKYAERQAKRAARFKDQLEQLKVMEIKKAFEELRHCEEQTSGLDQKRAAHQETLNRMEEQLSTKNKTMSELEARLRELEQLFYAQEAIRSDIKQKQVSIEDHEKFYREKIETLKLSNEKVLGEIESLKKRLAVVNGEIVRKEAEYKAILRDRDDILRNKLEKESVLETFASKDAIHQNELQQNKTRLFDLAREISDLKNKISKIDSDLQSIERSKHHFYAQKDKHLASLDSLLERNLVIRELKDFLQIKILEAEKNLRTVLNEKEEVASYLQQLLRESTEHIMEKAKIESQIQIFQEQHDAYQKDLKDAGSASTETLKLDFVKILSETISVKPGYEAALETALDELTSSLIASDLDSAATMVKQLKGANARRLNILIRSDLAGVGDWLEDKITAAHPLVGIPLLNVVEIEEGYSPLIRELLKDVYIIKDCAIERLRAVLALSTASTFVTPSGSFLFAANRIFYRNPSNQKTDPPPWTAKKDMRELRQTLDKASEKINNINNLCYQYEERLLILTKEEDKFREDLKKCQSAHARISASFDGIREQAISIFSELRLITAEGIQNAAEMKQLREERTAYSGSLTNLEATEADLRAIFDKLQHAISVLKEQKDHVVRDLSYILARFEVLREKEDDIENGLAFLKVQYSDIDQRVLILTSEREIAAKEVSKLTEELTKLEEEKIMVNQQVIEKTVLVEHTKKERNEVQTYRETLLSELNELTRSVSDEKQKFHEISIEEIEIGHRKENARHELQTRYKISLTELNPDDYVIADEERPMMEEEIEKLRSKLDEIGPVNLLAIEEHDELNQRYQFLVAQQKDLIDSKEQLLETIRKINRTTKKLFDETFLKVKESFQSYFKVLFSGGHADLILLDELHPLDSGIDIIARPPGKKPQHITLLSGGEKAMTALALLFSLFSVRPSPFCVLDEVDAPLDEANTDRFLSVLKPFLDTTQFIIVTHSRKTISIGDSLYGITMEEPGVSKIVSVRLSHDVEGIEHEDSKLAEEFNKVLV